MASSQSNGIRMPLRSLNHGHQISCEYVVCIREYADTVGLGGGDVPRDCVALGHACQSGNTSDRDISLSFLTPKVGISIIVLLRKWDRGGNGHKAQQDK